MTTPLASGRHVAAPGDTVNGNLKVVEFGLFGGSTCASPTTGASASAAVNIAVASFMENLLLLRMYELQMRCYRLRGREPTLNRSTVICCGLFVFVIVKKQTTWEPEHFLALRSRHILLPRTESPHPSSVRSPSFRGFGYGEHNSLLPPIQEVPGARIQSAAFSGEEGHFVADRLRPFIARVSHLLEGAAREL